MYRVFKIFSFILTITVLAFHPGPTALAQAKPGSPQPLKKCWEFGLGPAQTVEIAADNGVIYLASEDGKITAIDAKTADVLWKSEIGGRVISTIAFSEKHLLAASNPQGESDKDGGGTLLRAISKTTGLIDRTILMPHQDELLLAQWKGIVLAAAKSGWLAGFQLDSGEKLWEQNFNSQLSARPMFSDGALAIGTSSDGVFLIDAETGKELVAFNGDPRPTAIAALKTRQIVYGSSIGRMKKIDAENKPSRWKFRAGGQISGIEPNGDRILVSSYDNFIYMVSPRGSLDWKKRLPGRPSDNILLTDGVGVVSISGDGEAVVFNPENGRTINRVDFGDNIIQTAILADSGKIIFLIPGKIYLYSSNGCSSK